jgi:hypothetical protein
MNHKTLIEDFQRLRRHLNPILSEQYRKVLLDVEKQLSSGDNVASKNQINILKKKNPTKKELREYFNSKGL